MGDRPYTVRFNSIDEWMTELEQEHLSGHVDPPIIRATKSYQPTKMQPLRLLSVLATFRTRQGSIVQLIALCGDCVISSQNFDTDQPSIRRADAILKRIKTAVSGLGLELRAGVSEPA